ncbi:MAG TPA: hypothetical protein VGS20_05560 [Candidatus Acidoferrales bacterium]|nr:hypothetical protein [Candidatus Acidoferrales bacterium]
MNCAAEEALRAKLDGEILGEDSPDLDEHLAACKQCRRRLEEIRVGSEEVARSLGVLGPEPDSADFDGRAAYARLMERVGAEKSAVRPAWRAASRLLGHRPALTGMLAAAAALVVVFTGFAPARIWAQRVLEMLRIREVAAVPVDPALLPMGDRSSPIAGMIEKLMSDDVTVTLKPGPPGAAANAAEASALAGFPVRLLTNQPAQPKIRVVGEQAANMVIDRNRLQAILDSAGRTDLQIPASVNGMTIAVHIPKAVFAQYGNCPEGRPQAPLRAPQPADEPRGSTAADDSSCVTVAEIPSPTVSVPQELKISELAEIGLQFAGMTAQEAAEFCRTVDWTSTLVVPVPRNAGSYSTVDVDGARGELVAYPVWEHQQGYTLIWVKSGIVYAIAGFGGPASGLALAALLSGE